MNFKVGDVLCHHEKSFIFEIFDSTMPFLKIKYEIKSIDKPPLTDSNLNEEQKEKSYKIHVNVTGCDKLSEDERKQLSDKYFPQENLDLTKPEILTFLYYNFTSSGSYFYKNYTEEHVSIEKIPKFNAFYLIKCSDRVKIDGEFVIDGHNGKPVITIIQKTEEILLNARITNQGYYANDNRKAVPNTYIITYGDDEIKEITLYGPDKNNNYSILHWHKRCINGICKFLGFGGAKTKHHKKRKGRSKTRKRRKSKKLHK